MGDAVAGAPERTVERVVALLTEAGRHGHAGGAISRLEHALQAARLAEEAGLDEEVVVACLLHDLGHSTPEARAVQEGAPGGGATSEPVPERGDAGAALLGESGSPRLRWLIANHATAKRYLCAVDPDYYDRLSPLSKQTLADQGGPLGPLECAELERHPWREELIALRRVADEATVPGRPKPDLTHYRPLLERQLDPGPGVT